MKAYGSRRIYDTPPQMKAARARVKKEGEAETEAGLELNEEMRWMADEIADEANLKCEHARIASEVCDQTLGVGCLDCHRLLAVCWGDEHVPESLWNRACENDPDAVPCEQNRDDHCAICEGNMTTVADKGAATMKPIIGRQCQTSAFVDAVKKRRRNTPEQVAAMNLELESLAADFRYALDVQGRLVRVPADTNLK